MPTIKTTCKRPWMPERKPHEGRKNPNKKFYQSMPWRRLRATKIDQQPLCEECERKNIVTVANMVDHIVPINKGGEPLDISNLQSLCNRCHNQKSGRESRL